MKIFHVIDSGGLYGAEVMLLNLMAAQKAMGLHPVLISIGTPDYVSKAIETRATEKKLAVIPWRMKAGPNIAGARSLLKLARREGVDLFHSHGYKSNILLGLLSLTRRTIPLITTVHGWTWTGGFNRMMIYEWLDALSFRFVDHVVVVNKVMLQHPRLKALASDRRSTVNNGIDFSLHDEIALSALPTADQAFISRRFTVVAVGRFSPEKGFALLIRAIGSLVRQGYDLQLLLLGDGGLRNTFVSLAESQGIVDRVRMPGHVEHVIQYLRQCQLFVMPSLTEGLPMALLEAMYAKIPIIASRVGGIPEALLDGRAGRLVEPGLEDDLKRSIRQLYDDPKSQRETVILAKQQAQSGFSSRKMAEEYLDIYAKILKAANFQMDSAC